MAQAARNTARSTRTYTTAQRGAIIARRAAARRAVPTDAPKVEMIDPAMLAACVEAAGFADHAAY